MSAITKERRLTAEEEADHDLAKREGLFKIGQKVVVRREPANEEEAEITNGWNEEMATTVGQEYEIVDMIDCYQNDKGVYKYRLSTQQGGKFRDYWYAQFLIAPALKVGDYVTIHKSTYDDPFATEESGVSSWVENMDRADGQVGIVVSADYKGSNFQVKEEKSGTWYYKGHWLEYYETIDEIAFEVGDKVLIERKPSKEEMPAGFVWASKLDKHVGKHGEVIKVMDDKKRFVLSIEGGKHKECYPRPALRKLTVVEEKESPIVIGDVVQIDRLATTQELVGIGGRGDTDKKLIGKIGGVNMVYPKTDSHGACILIAFKDGTSSVYMPTAAASKVSKWKRKRYLES